MATLYAAGWRQGTIFGASLPLVGLVLDDSGQIILDSQSHQRWIIATQDCDLDRYEATVPDSLIELRPVFTDTPPTSRGIRSRKFLLYDRQYIDAESRRMMISPAVLMLLADTRVPIDNRIADDPERKAEYKTWLGYRYDRPAVPPDLVELAQAIASAIAKQAQGYSGRVRDILVQFQPTTPPAFDLFAIIMDETDRDVIEEWLIGAVLEVETTLGVLSSVQAVTADRASLSLIETSFAADLSRITWTSNGLRGEPGLFTRPVE